MPNHNDSPAIPASVEEAGVSPTPTNGLSEEAQATPGGLYSGLNDPNAAALNDNASAAQMRQLTGEPPGSESETDGSGLLSSQSDAFKDGT